MVKSILDGKRILAVDDEPDVLETLQEEIMAACPNCHFEKASTYEAAKERLKSQTYDVAILDIMGVRGFELLDFAAGKNLRVVMLTANALTPEALKRSFDMKARAYLPKEKLGEIVPFIEDVLHSEYLPGWRKVLEKLKEFFDEKFESDWDKKVGLNWKQFGRPS
jgi:DNA-binding response OmpR family regulator